MDYLTDLGRIGLVLDEPAPMRVKVCAARCRRFIDTLPEPNKAGDAFLVIRQLLFAICADAYWPPTIDRDQTVRNLVLAVVDELHMHGAQQGRSP
jgi:hypothetical protein